MFVIASSGRCGTMALARGLDACSDHRVEHEPEPRLLEEASRRHLGEPYASAGLTERLERFRRLDGRAYGETFRAPNMLDLIMAAAPRTRFLIVVRNPFEYVISAHGKRVFSKGDVWDQTRLMPVDREEHSLAGRIALHWNEVNGYLLDFAENAEMPVMILQPLEPLVEKLADLLGVRLTNRERLVAMLGAWPNATMRREVPEGYEERYLQGLVGATWQRAMDAAIDLR